MLFGHSRKYESVCRNRVFSWTDRTIVGFSSLVAPFETPSIGSASIARGVTTVKRAPAADNASIVASMTARPPSVIGQGALVATHKIRIPEALSS